MSGSPDSVRIVTPLRQRSLQSVLAKSRSLAELSAELPDHSAPKAVAKVQERPKSSRGRNPKDKDAVREELREYIVSNGGVDDGKWEVEIVVRKDGVTKGSHDVYFYHPTVVKKLRSKAEVSRHLGLAVTTHARKKAGTSTAAKSKPAASASAKPAVPKPGSSLLTPKKRPLSTPGSLGKTHHPSSTDYSTHSHSAAAPSDAPRSAFKRPKAVSGEPSQPLLTKAKPKPHVNYLHQEDRAVKLDHPKPSHQVLTSASTATNHSNEQRGNQANYNPRKRQFPHETSALREVPHAVHQGRPSDGSKSTDPMQRSSVSAATQGHMHMHHAHNAHASDPPQQLPFDKRRSSASGSVFEASQNGSQKTPRLGVEPKAPVPKFPSTAAQPRASLNSNLNLNVPDKDTNRGEASAPSGGHSQEPTPRMSTTGAALRTPISGREAPAGERRLSAPSRVGPRTMDGPTKPSVDESQNAAVALASFKKAISGLEPVLSTAAESGSHRHNLAQQAKRMAGQLKLPLPMKLPHGVDLLRAGRLVEGHGFMKPMHLSPVGLLSWWKDETKSFTLIFSIGKAECKQSAATDKSAQPRIQPLFKIAAVKGDAKAPRANESIKQANPMLVLLVMSSVSPSDALKELVSKQELAKALQKDPNFKIQPPASDCIASTQKWYKQRQAHLQQLRDIPSLFQMLCELPLPPVRWPKLLFGLSQPAVLAALEAQDVVEKSTEYQYVEGRRGWQHEQRLLESELHLYEAQAFKDGLLPEAHTSPGNPYIIDLKLGVMGANSVHRQ